MKIKTILFPPIITGLILTACYMAGRKIKWQDERIDYLERLLEPQGKVKDGTLDVG